MTKINITIDEQFPKAQVFHTMVCAISEYDFPDFIRVNDEISVRLIDRKDDILVVSYYSQLAKCWKNLFCFERNQNMNGKIIYGAITTGIMNEFAEFMI